MRIPALLLIFLACTGTVHSVQNLYTITSAEEAYRYGQELAQLEERYNSKDETVARKAQEEIAVMAKEYAKHYDIKNWDIEKGDNLEIFAISLWDISDTNLKVKENGWWGAITFFTGISDEEFETRYLMTDFEPTKTNLQIRSNFPVPQLGWDWDAQGKVTAAKNQGSCGSCWAFAAIGALESRYLINKGLSASDTNIDLSEQQMLNCVNSARTSTTGTPYSDNTCSGGWSDQVMDYVRKFNVTTEDVVPYVASAQACVQNPLVRGRPARALKQYVPNPGFYTVPPSNLTAFKQAIRYTPIAFYLRVESSFKIYSGGIYSTPCTDAKINHAMLAYGYMDSPIAGADKFFRVKNSWGVNTWGESGKMRIRMDTSAGGMNEGLCRMMKFAYYPNAGSQFYPALPFGL